MTISLKYPRWLWKLRELFRRYTIFSAKIADLAFRTYPRNISISIHYHNFRTFYRGVPDYAIDCPRGVWFREPVAFLKLVHLMESFCRYDTIENAIVFYAYVFAYILISHNMTIHCVCLLYFHDSNIALVFPITSRLSHKRNRDAFIQNFFSYTIRKIRYLWYVVGDSDTWRHIFVLQTLLEISAW